MPASTILGGMIGARFFMGQKELVSLLAAAGLIALFTAFFHSFWIGLLSLVLVLSQSKAKFKPVMLLIAAIASAASYVTLHFIEAKPYVELPGGTFNLDAVSVILGLTLIVVGYGMEMLLAALHTLIAKLKKNKQLKDWMVRSIVASLGLAILFLIGGPLVEFTGNKSIMPMFDEAAKLGLGGLLWILVIKIVAISWSKAIGYRGGMIFPVIFLASVVVAIVQLYIPEFNVAFGVIAILAGALFANKKNHILA